MDHLKTFWQTVVKSATEPLYYIDILRSKFVFSLKFYLLLLIFLSLTDVLILRFRELPQFFSNMNQESAHAVAALPDTFQTSYSELGRLTTTGINLPFSIDATSKLQNYGFQGKLITLAKDDNSTLNSFITLTPTRVILADPTDIGSTSQALNFKDLLGAQNFSLTKTQIESKRVEFFVQVPKITNLIFLAAFPISYLALLLATTLTLLFLTLLANSVMWVVGIHMPLLKTLQLGLHAIGIATLIDVIKYALYPTTDISLVIPGYIGIMTLVMWSLRSAKRSV